MKGKQIFKLKYILNVCLHHLIKMTQKKYNNKILT